MHTGRIGETEIVATTTGIGTAGAKRATEQLLDATPVDHVMVVGIAGGVGPTVKIGDLIYADIVIDKSTGTEYRPTHLGAPDGARHDRHLGRLPRRAGHGRGAHGRGRHRARHGDVGRRRGVRIAGLRLVGDPSDQRHGHGPPGRLRARPRASPTGRRTARPSPSSCSRSRGGSRTSPASNATRSSPRLRPRRRRGPRLRPGLTPVGARYSAGARRCSDTA